MARRAHYLLPMQTTVTMVREGVAELTLPEACMVCGGDVQVRMNPSGAFCFCDHCHLITTARTRIGDEGLRVDFRVGGRA